MIKIKIVNDDLPYRIQIDALEGAGQNIKSAAMAALSAGHKIPMGMRDGKQAAMYIFWNYEVNSDWYRLISLLENGDSVICPECLEIRPFDDRVRAGMKCGLCAYGGNG